MWDSATCLAITMLCSLRLIVIVSFFPLLFSHSTCAVEYAARGHTSGLSHTRQQCGCAQRLLQLRECHHRAGIRGTAGACTRCCSHSCCLFLTKNTSFSGSFLTPSLSTSLLLPAIRSLQQAERQQLLLRTLCAAAMKDRATTVRASACRAVGVFASFSLCLQPQPGASLDNGGFSMFADALGAHCSVFHLCFTRHMGSCVHAIGACLV